MNKVISFVLSISIHLMVLFFITKYIPHKKGGAKTRKFFKLSVINPTQTQEQEQTPETHQNEETQSSQPDEKISKLEQTEIQENKKDQDVPIIPSQEIDNPQKAQHTETKVEQSPKELPDIKPEKPVQIDKRALYSSNEQTPTSKTSGAILEMEGWEWDDVPKPEDNTDEVGKIVFEITIDHLGDIVSIKTLKRSVNIEIANIYRKSLESLTFSRKSSNMNNYNRTLYKGKVTFILSYK